MNQSYRLILCAVALVVGSGGAFLEAKKPAPKPAPVSKSMAAAIAAAIAKEKAESAAATAAAVEKVKAESAAGIAATVANAVAATKAAAAAALAAANVKIIADSRDAQDSPALQQLPAGTTVAIYSYSKKKYLKLEKSGADYKYLRATGESKDDPFCQFQVVRHSDHPLWIGFQSLLHYGRNLQSDVSDAATRVCRFENHNFGNWEQWALIPENSSSLEAVRLSNRETKGSLCVPPDERFDGRVATNSEQGKLAGFGDWERLKIEIIQPVQPQDRPGGSEFTYKRFMRDGAHIAFSEKWKFRSGTKGLVKFRASAPKDIYVAFSPNPSWTGDRTYWYAIGGWHNRRSCLFKNWVEIGARSLDESDPKKIAATLDDVVTGGWGVNGDSVHNKKTKTGDIDWQVTGNYKGNAVDDYWASYEIVGGKIKFAWGKGKLAGKNIRMQYEVDNPALPELGYLGLGGWFLNVEFTSIQIDPAETEDEQVVSVIAGFEEIEGVAARLSIGGQRASGKEPSKHNKFLAMMVARADGKLFKMDSTTMGGWNPVVIKVGDKSPTKFVDVSVAADGAVGVLADNGELFFSYNGGKDWKSYGIPLLDDKKIVVDRVAVSSKHMVAVLDKELGDVFKYVHASKDDSTDQSHWECIAREHAMSIAPGYPDILIAINKSLDCYQLQGSDWIEFPNPSRIGRLAVIDLKNMYGTVEKDGRFYLNKLENGEWKPVLDAAGKPVEGIKEAATNSAGALLVMTIKGQILKKGVLDLPLHVVEPEHAGHKDGKDGKAAASVASLDIPGFAKMDGLAYRIALGSARKGSEGKFIGMMIAKDTGTLFKRNRSKKNVWSWDPVVIKVGESAPSKFMDVAVSEDGVIGALASSGELFVSHNGGTKWKSLGTPSLEGQPVVCERLAIANKNLIVILDKQSGDIFKYDKADKDSWTRLLDGNITALAAAHPDILIAVEKSLDCQQFKSGGWVNFPNPFRISRFAIVDLQHMYGILEKDGRGHLNRFQKGSWIPMLDEDGKPITGIKQIAATPSGGLWLMTSKGEIYRKELKGKGNAGKSGGKKQEAKRQGKKQDAKREGKKQDKKHQGKKKDAKKNESKRAEPKKQEIKKQKKQEKNKRTQADKKEDSKA
jgi:hypothetical protein